MQSSTAWKAIATTLVLTSLVGCSSSSSSDSASGTQTINAWIMGDGTWKDFYSKLADQFHQENPDIQVKLDFIPWDQGHDKLITAAASDAGPDVTTDGGRWTTELAVMGALEPLDDFLNDTYKKDFVDAAWETTQWKGRTWGIPQGFTTTALFYRTDWLQQAGYDHPPKNWAEFEDLAKKMTHNHHYGFALVGDNSMDTTMFWTPFLWQNGGELLSKDLKKATFNSYAGIQALQFYVDLYRKDHAAPDSALSTKRNDANKLFTNGIAGMTTTGPWFFSEIKRDKPDLPFAVAPYPVGKQAATLATTDHIVMLKSAKNKQACWKWIDFVTNPQNSQAWNQTIGFIPYRKSGLAALANTSDPNFKVLLNEVQNAHAYPTLPDWPQIDDEIANAVQTALAGKKAPKEALDDAAKKVDEILAQSN
ncbi:extracellular solute-binding protein [Tumebacillus sp. ITR2]|uniref:Extracellular solute-binding protein n=1 Tax=Tumebacillus amylolyticus TaxID=2801339 RepID=A0ABS1J475_9BACL|nr:extracellular solute-binding protein [Tumebacillus amylolyticus]MBL0385068.1 extracellular solute-binding protein [Tumebacillus amylolyticus]